MAQSDVSVAAFSGAVEAIYDCALNPDNWHTAIRVVADLLNSPKITLGMTDYANSRELNLYQYGFDDEKFRKLYFEKYAASNPIFVGGHLLPVGSVYTMSMVVDEQEFLESRFYHELLKPLRLTIRSRFMH